MIGTGDYFGTEETMKNTKQNYTHIGSLLWALKRMWKLERVILIFVFLNIPFRVGAPLATSYFGKVLIDILEKGSTFSEFAVIVVSCMCGILLLEFLEVWTRCGYTSRRLYVTHVYQMEMGALVNDEMDYETTESQDFQKISQYAFRDASKGNCSAEYVWRDLSAFLVAVTGMITYGSILGVLNPILFSVVLVVSFLSYFTTRWQPKYYEKNKHHFEKESRKIGYLGELSENFAAAKDIKLYGLEKWLDTMLRDYQSYILMWEKKCSLRGVFASLVSGAMSLLQNGTAYVVLIGLLMRGEITVGDFVFYFGMVSSIAGYLRGIITGAAKLSTRAEKIDYYRDFYGYPNKLNQGEGCELSEGAVKIEFRDVWYRYAGAETDTLKGINLTIEAGESLALVGLNGAGKTTLVKLLCGFYHPTKGEILVNGRRIEEYNIKEYYSLISAVFQEITPVAFTVFEFVASADPERKSAREDAVQAMREAGIWEKIAGLQCGMDTHLMKGIYEDGVDLSGGEMQKLALARAIYKGGAILLLDEPTAALDPITENQLYLKYRSLTEGKTSIYISHRFASTRFCDRIILLEQGVIRECGTHEELMDRNGQYAYLFGVQAEYYKEGNVNV